MSFIHLSSSQLINQYLCLFVYPSTCMKVYHLSVFLSMCPAVGLSNCPSILHLFMHRYTSIFLSVYLTVCPPVNQSFCLSFYPSTCSVSIHLYVFVSFIRSSVCLSVSLSICSSNQSVYQPNLPVFLSPIVALTNKAI
jgi:hypothetical protein